MANNCGFSITLRGENKENMRRVCDIISGDDLQYAVVRTWLGCGSIIDEDDDSITIEGECPWTADFFWRPDMTIAGRDKVVGESKDPQGRTYVSIPYLCTLWDLTANGWEEEWGCCVDGWFSCGKDGVVHYRDTWGNVCIEHMESEPDDEWCGCLRQAVSDGRCEGCLDEALQLIAAYEEAVE